MKIKLEGKYKSLTDFETPNLEEFAVVTGLNGSGKSQFLELINFLQNKTEYSQSLNSYKFKITIVSDNFVPGSVKYIAYNDLNPKSLGSMNKKTYENIKFQIIQNFENIRHNKDFPQKHIALRIADSLDKDIKELTEEDVFEYHFSHEDLSSTDIFQTNLGQLFYNFAYSREKNEYKKFRNEKYGANFDVLDDEEFEKKYINPWEIINKFLEKSKSDYQVEGVSEEDFNENITLAPKFIHKVTGDKIDVGALSSGERVIVSLAFCLFNIEIGESSIFPRILLLDEPDAPLHPSMTKEFLDVIYEELVVKKGIRVILTTHSPSTIALTDNNFIYCMSKDDKRFVKATKDKTLGMLTEGLNTISIDYENRRQVFVESNYDRKFYEMIYKKLKPELMEDISLHFISSGTDKIPVSSEVPDGDCGRVKNVVKELTSGGNTKVFGIIDWDNKNQKQPFIFVNGDKERYSIENYIFDPILLAALLLDYQLIDRNDLGLNNNENYSNFEKLSVAKLNDIAEFIIENIKQKLDKKPTNTGNRSIEYVNGLTVQVPKWYLQYPGHDLEIKIIEAFP
ncbi:MAG: ATP-binding protein, partial [Candidatus Paceibacterota bacterium]